MAVYKIHKKNGLIHDYFEYRDAIVSKYGFCNPTFYFAYDCFDSFDKPGSNILTLLFVHKDSFKPYPSAFNKRGYYVKKVDITVLERCDMTNAGQNIIIQTELQKIEQMNSVSLTRGEQMDDALRKMVGRNIMFVDLETTGLPCVGLSKHTNITDLTGFSDSRVVQIGYAFYENMDFAHLQQQNAESILIKPSGFSIPRIATQIHGITNEMANEAGISFRSAEFMGSAFRRNLHKTDYIIAYNAWFDTCILASELFRFDDPLAFKMMDLMKTDAIVCLAELSKKLCPPVTGFVGRIPKQRDVYLRCFNRVPQNQHDAKGDVIAMIEIINFMAENKLTAQTVVQAAPAAAPAASTVLLPNQ